uniref:OCA domain-containing protein n=1 Tax=Astatotilapia calliptera TaxID=8154 RepID=A0AAX7TS45_ASTCA
MTRCAAMMLAGIACLFSRGASLQCSRSSVPPKPSGVFAYEYSKRVYQGVRVKHTVKDLLAEKRSRQTNGPRYSGGSTTPPSFVQMPGAHMLPSYYGIRGRSFISDSDFCPSTKQFSPDVYSSTLGGKPLGCEPSTMSSYSSLIDSYYPETFGDYRSAATFSSSGGSFLPSSALSSLLPPFGGESSHLFLRDSWEQSEPVSQVEALCQDNLASVSVPPSMPSPEPPGSPSQYRSPSRSSSLGPVSSSQPYTLHSLEDVHYHPLTSTSTYPTTPSSSSFPCPPYMSSPVTDLVTKMVTEEAADGHGSLTPGAEAHSSWAKEEGVSAWSPYEIRRAY